MSSSYFFIVFSASRDNVVMALTTYGGHMGYFEGSPWYPNTLSWLDKLVVQYADAVLQTLHEGNEKEL